jgi:nicotinate dehydrogenase subunit A
MKETLTLKVNGRSHKVTIDPSTPLLYVLRNQLELNGPKYGCGLQQCGACMVLLDGKAQPSCMISAKSAKGHAITTLEGIARDKQTLHPVQEAFVKEQAAQCGYCLNGMVISAVSLLNENPNPNDKEIREGLQRNVCRCGTHSRIIKAVKRAAAVNK